MRSAKTIIMAAKAVSVVSTPFSLRVVALASLLVLTYLNLLPVVYKLTLLVVFWLFTVFMPTMLIRLYRRYQGWTRLQLGARERRVIPYVISIVSYLAGYYTVVAAHVPYFLCAIFIVALVIQVACAMANLFVKISTHTAGIGGVAGSLAAFALIMDFNPVWWLCAVILLAGLVGTSRMILRQHSLRQVVSGFLVGTACSFVTVLLV